MVKKLSFALIVFLLFASITEAEKSKGEWIKLKNKDCFVWNSNPSPDEYVTWTGGCRNGKAHGYGVQRWFVNGSLVTVYKGEMEYGRTNGKGMVYLTNCKLKGEFKNGKILKGETYFNNGDYTFAHYNKNGYREGWGVLCESGILRESKECGIVYFTGDNYHDRKSIEDAIKENSTQSYNAFYALHTITNVVKNSPELLSIAAKYGNFEIVKLLIGNGVDVNYSKNYLYRPPLHAAVIKGNYAIVKFLVKNGADINLKSGRDQCRPLHVIFFRKFLSAEDVKIIKFLISRGANINARDRAKATPLHIAARNGLIEAIKILIENGADTYAEDYSGKTPYEVARKSEVKRLFKGHSPDSSLMDDLGKAVLILVAASIVKDAIDTDKEENKTSSSNTSPSSYKSSSESDRIEIPGYCTIKRDGDRYNIILNDSGFVGYVQKHDDRYMVASNSKSNYIGYIRFSSPNRYYAHPYGGTSNQNYVGFAVQSGSGWTIHSRDRVVCQGVRGSELAIICVTAALLFYDF
jgi:hypothetical protein